MPTDQKWLKNGADRPKWLKNTDTDQKRCRQTKYGSRTVPTQTKNGSRTVPTHQIWLKNGADTKYGSRTVPTDQIWLKNGADTPNMAQERFWQTKKCSTTVRNGSKMVQERCRLTKKVLNNGADKPKSAHQQPQITKRCSTTGGKCTNKLIGFSSIRIERFKV